MDDVGRMHILKATQELVQKVAGVLWGKCLGRMYNLMQVTLHKIQHHISAQMGRWKTEMSSVGQYLNVKHVKTFLFRKTR